MTRHMNKTIFTLISIAGLMAPLNGHASGLIPEQCTIGDRPVCHPIVDIGFTFDGAIGITGNSIATVYAGNEPVAAGGISAFNYTGAKRIQGTAVVTFETPLSLPKGKTYTLVVPEGVIFQEGHPTISNDAISVEFEVPGNLGEATPSIENGSIVQNANRIGFYFGIETASVENGEFILYRGDVPVKRYPCDVSWDWNLGYAGINFGETVNFESGVEYTVKLPKGCVSSLHRSDITNEEISLNFIGGYTEPIVPIQYVWCSLFDHHPTDVMGEVKFYYNQPVMLSVNPIVQLCIETDGIIVKEAVPSIAEENGQYVMTVNFDNTPLTSEKGYTIIIPEGTLVTENGDVIVNPRSIMAVSNSSGISDIKDTECNIKVVNGTISIDNATNGNDIMLYSLDGKIVYNAKSNGGIVSIPVGTTGIYLLSIDGTTYKIAIRK